MRDVLLAESLDMVNAFNSLHGINGVPLSLCWLLNDYLQDKVVV